MTAPILDLIHALKNDFSGEIRLDPVTRLLYATDASIYQIEPLGVAFPRSLDDLAVLVATCAAQGVPLLARGAGSSLAGQAIGPALIVDCARHLNRIIEINPQARTAVVEPGVVLAEFNRQAGRYALQFGPDPASAERATLGGSLANNASGAHSIVYGMAADHLLAAEVVLADGQVVTLEEITLDQARDKAGAVGTPGSIEQRLYRAALDIRERQAEAIYRRWPRIWRRASGYGLNYLLPWSPSAPPQWQGYPPYGSSYPPAAPGGLNLAPVLAGSEGTLAVFRTATVRLVPVPRHTLLAVLAYPSIAAACRATPALLGYGPSAVELIPAMLIKLARQAPAYARLTAFVEQLSPGRIPEAILVVEFAGDDLDELRRRGRALGAGVYLAESAAAQREVWAVRKVGLGILQSRPGDRRSATFIEDLAVPVERLGEFVSEVERILAAHGASGDIYAHASAGCLHIRPMLDLKTVAGVTELRAIAAEAVSLALSLGGATSGEHGDGLARSEWLEQMYGAELIAVFRQLKQAADPNNLLNPGKILDAQPMDTNLRYGPHYQAQAWQTTMNFTRQAGLVGAVEQCNGAGVCRKSDGVMCPSFQASQEEGQSTRGRANLLRALLSGRFETRQAGEQAVYAALDLCLACKGCKAECPSGGVDMAKLKYEFMHHYYDRHARKLRDYLFGFIGPLAALGWPLAGLANAVLHSKAFGGVGERLLGLSRQRPFPLMAGKPLGRRINLGARPPEPGCLVLMDAFNAFFYPETGQATLDVLAAAGCAPLVLPVYGAGRTLISKGFLDAARRHAARVVRAIAAADPQLRLPVVGVEPSEILTLRDEYPDLLHEDEGLSAIVDSLAERAWMIDEFLVRVDRGVDSPIMRIANYTNIKNNLNTKPKILLHGHCYQKAQPPASDGCPSGVNATIAMLEAVGYDVQTIPSGCCGMAGAFGYESEHFALSMQVGELALFPAVRRASEGCIVAASGVSCQAQIEDGTQRRALHPIQLVNKLLAPG